ncbi:type IV secretion system protein VirB10 [Roseateles sp. BYS96W]|uniref:Type IV secretion system protein VirB10 n=1 Tax=Pelomonas nitida TaxID=3299027 RepID=A0ABW7G9S0_9BURK
MTAHQPQPPDDALAVGREPGANTMAALVGEPGIPNVAAPRQIAISRKGLAALLLLTGLLIGLLAFGIHRFALSGKEDPAEAHVRIGDKPTAASAEPRKLDMAAASAPTANPAPRIPALLPDANESAEPIGVIRTGEAGPHSSGTKRAAPEDAPTLLVSSRPNSHATGAAPSTAHPQGAPEASQAATPDDPLAATTRNLEGYQRQLQGLLDNLTRPTNAAGAEPVAMSPAAALLNAPPAAGPMAQPGGSTGGLFNGQLQGSTTARVAAATLGDRSLTLPKGTAFTCALKTRVISAASGLVGCQVQRNVFSDDGRVLLIERGSHLDGEYRITSVRPGMVRIPVLWTRIRTPLGVTVDIDSPATGPLGEAGIDGYVDNRWPERIGAAMLMSLIDDSVKLVIQNQANERQGDTIVLPYTTANTSKLAEKVLDSTINIPPLVYQNQGGIVGIYVARDVDFSSVYELRPSKR